MSVQTIDFKADFPLFAFMNEDEGVETDKEEDETDDDESEDDDDFDSGDDDESKEE